MFDGEVRIENGKLVFDGAPVTYLSERDLEALPWQDFGVDIVVEATGIFRKKDQLAKHVKAGAEKVILTAPAKDVLDATVVLGVNDGDLKPEHTIVSNASCTTNCLAPVLKVLHDRFTVKRGFMTTVHAFTNDQRVLDVAHSDLRRARAASVSIIPTKTGAASAIGLVIPDLDGKLDAFALRVPVANGSNIDVTVETETGTTIENVNAAFKEAAENKLKGILEYTEEPLVSVDIIGNSHSAIYDSLMTRVMGGNLVKVLAWYDNEWGYSCRVIDLIKKMGG
jgi:glyceraldehyde 3-phosphate dehydrogenase